MDTKEAEARWRLYSSQILLGISLYYKDDDLALKTLESARTGLEALVNEQSANVQYRRDRAVAMAEWVVQLEQHNRTSEAVEPARQAVAMMTPLAAADPRNAGFQRWISAIRGKDWGDFSASPAILPRVWITTRKRWRGRRPRRRSTPGTRNSPL
jgi:hypothetical protein